jgi:hypothetical protein
MALAELFDDHAAAVRECIDAARAVPDARWHQPRAPGKWTPAQEIRHLSLGYAAFERDLRGEGAMQLRGRWWQRRIWRAVALRYILRNGRIPRAAPAPREVRPPDGPGDRVSLIAEFEERVRSFETLLRETMAREPRRRVTHPYFNALSLEQLLRFGAIHTRHHAAFVRESTRKA